MGSHIWIVLKNSTVNHTVLNLRDCAHLQFLCFLKKIRINSRNEDGQSALHLACVHGCVMRAKALLDAGCDPRAEDNRRQTPLHLAAAQGHTVVMDMLLK